MRNLLILLAAFLFVSCQPGTKVIETDVLVVGGTTGGTSAGIAAARGGARTIIVEWTPWLGGMLTAQGVGAVDGNHELPSGIWNEFREALRTRYGGQGALWTGWVSATQFEPHVGDSIFKAMAAREELLDVLYGYRVTGIIKTGNKVGGAEFEDRDGNKIKVRAKVVIDATDLGDCLPLAGAGYRVGMDSRHETGEYLAPEQANDIVQDLTWVAVLKDYGPNADMTIPMPEGYDPAQFEGCCKPSLDPGQTDCENMISYGKMPGGKYMINWPHKGNDIYLNVVELPYELRDRELEKAKNYTLRFVYHIQAALGFANLGLADDEFDTEDRLAYAPYHREGRRLKGTILFTLNDVQDRYGQPDRLYRTGISVGDYPVDHHHAANLDSPELKFPPVPSFCVPLGALIPEGVDGLIVADKAISVSNLINGSTRLQPVVLLTGQGAGTLAALSAAAGVEVRDVPVREVQSALLEQGACIMPLFDVKPDDPDFGAIQRVAATGILKCVGEPFHWSNRTWFYPEQTVTTEEFMNGLKELYDDVAGSGTDEPVTRRNAVNILTSLGVTGLTGGEDEPITRRELARLIDASLDPFGVTIDHHGHPVN